MKKQFLLSTHILVGMATVVYAGEDEKNSKTTIDKEFKAFVDKDYNTWDSLAEAYMKKGDNEKAITYYKKSIELNPENANAKARIEEMLTVR